MNLTDAFCDLCEKRLRTRPSCLEDDLPTKLNPGQKATAEKEGPVNYDLTTINPIRAELFLVDRRTSERHDEVTVAFYNCFANVPKKDSFWYSVI